MYKLLVLTAIICTVNAGLILDHKPAVIVTHGATSHANSNLVSVHPVPIVAHRTAVVHAAPVIAHAPIAVAHAPVVTHAVVHHPVAIRIHH